METREKKVRGRVGTKTIKPTIAHKHVSPFSEEGKTRKPLTPKQQEKLNEKLLQAVENGKTKEVETLLELGAGVNVRNEWRSTALMYAAMNGHIDICKLLIEKGADMNIQNKDGRTALIVAADNGHTEMCKLLIENGADVNIRDEDGNTAFMWAVGLGHTDTVRYLLSVGSNPFLKDRNGKTAYDWANDEEIKQIIKTFEELWKRLGKEQVLILIQNVNIAIRECSPADIKEIFERL